MTNDCCQTPQYYIPKPLDRWRISQRVKLIFRFVPGVFKFLRLLVFVYLEWTFRQFYLDENATKLRNRAQLRSRKYIEKTAPSMSSRKLLEDLTLTRWHREILGSFEPHICHRLQGLFLSTWNCGGLFSI